MRNGWTLGLLLTGGLLAAGYVHSDNQDSCAKTVRMSESASGAIKRDFLRAAKQAGTIPADANIRDVELDHIRPLCLGGKNDTSNLQLQPWPEARQKDKLEWKACAEVRAHILTCPEAISWFVDWKSSYKLVFGTDP